MDNKADVINLMLMGAAFGYPFGLPKLSPCKDVCVECGTKIPPGKAGRKCKECRNVDSP